MAMTGLRIQADIDTNFFQWIG